MIRIIILIFIPAAYWVAMYSCAESRLQFILYSVIGVPLILLITAHYVYRFDSPGFEDNGDA